MTELQNSHLDQWNHLLEEMRKVLSVPEIIPSDVVDGFAARGQGET